MKQKEIIESILIILLIIVFIVGIAGFFHEPLHIVEGEGTAKISILGIGRVSGDPHIVMKFMGFCCVAFSVGSFLKMYSGMSWREIHKQSKKGFRRIPTALGKRLEQMKRAKREDDRD